MLSADITSCKKLNDVPGVLILSSNNFQNLNPIHFANIFGTFAKSVNTTANVMRLKTDSRFKGLLERAIDWLQRDPDSFQVRQIASITHSLGKLLIFDERFFKTIVKV